MEGIAVIYTQQISNSEINFVQRIPIPGQEDSYEVHCLSVCWGINWQFPQRKSVII